MVFCRQSKGTVRRYLSIAAAYCPSLFISPCARASSEGHQAARHVELHVDTDDGKISAAQASPPGVWLNRLDDSNCPAGAVAR
jgi:hypothetical protein